MSFSAPPIEIIVRKPQSPKGGMKPSSHTGGDVIIPVVTLSGLITFYHRSLILPLHPSFTPTSLITDFENVKCLVYLHDTPLCVKRYLPFIISAE